jgi:hypothetical protein
MHESLDAEDGLACAGAPENHRDAAARQTAVGDGIEPVDSGRPPARQRRFGSRAAPAPRLLHLLLRLFNEWFASASARIGRRSSR